MKKIITLIIISFALCANKSNAQDIDFMPSWYIVENGCQFSDGSMSSESETSDSAASIAVSDIGRGYLSVGEVVFAYMKSGGVYYCISPSKESHRPPQS